MKKAQKKANKFNNFSITILIYIYTRCLMSIRLVLLSHCLRKSFPTFGIVRARRRLSFDNGFADIPHTTKPKAV